MKEFDEPFVLLQNGESHFCEMVRQVGQSEFGHLMDVARTAYFRNRTEFSAQEPVQLLLSQPGEGMSPSDDQVTKEADSRSDTLTDDGDVELLSPDSRDVNTRLESTDSDQEVTETMPLNVDV